VATALLPDAVGNQNVPMEVELEVGRETLGYADGGWRSCLFLRLRRQCHGDQPTCTGCVIVRRRLVVLEQERVEGWQDKKRQEGGANQASDHNRCQGALYFGPGA